MIGVISKVKFGFGGYQDAMLGIHLIFESDTYGVQDFIGAGWTSKLLDSEFKSDGPLVLCHRIAKILDDAGVDDIQKLVGIPVDITLEKGRLVSWRVLTEAILKKC